MQQGTVSSADRLSHGVIAWPQVRRIPMKTSKKSHKKEDPAPKRIGACGGPWDPIAPPHGYPLGPPRPPRDGTSTLVEARATRYDYVYELDRHVVPRRDDDPNAKVTLLQ